jgi:hypothetical protein
MKKNYTNLAGAMIVIDVYSLWDVTLCTTVEGELPYYMASHPRRLH